MVAETRLRLSRNLDSRISLCACIHLIQINKGKISNYMYHIYLDIPLINLMLDALMQILVRDSESNYTLDILIRHKVNIISGACIMRSMF